MKKRANNEIFLPKIMIAIALIAILGVALWGFFGQDTVAVQNAKEAYAQYLSENPGSQDKDFIYIYEDTVIVAIRNGKVVRKEYATEADAVKAALGSKDGANYSLAGTGDGKLFVVKLFQKTDDIYALGTSTLATGADKLSIKVVSNGMIFATFDIPAEAIDRKESPVCITVKKINPEDNVKLGKNETGFAYDIDVTNLVKDNTARIAITMNGPKALVADANKSPITVYHKDKNIVSSYDPVTGQISFETTSFSPFTCTYTEKEVNSLAELRYYLQHPKSWNIKLGDEFAGMVDNVITINLDKGDREVGVDGQQKYTNTTYGEMYAAKGYYYGEWLYFGAVVSSDKALNLNGKTIRYYGDVEKDDNALFCVDGKTNFAIYDDSGKNGAIEVMFDHYAVWAVENTSSVSIYDGVVFAGGSYANAENKEPQRALIYSSGGEINIYGGHFLYENTNFVDDVDDDGNPLFDEEGNPIKISKTNGGFNVLNTITKPRIWIHEGAFLSNEIYRQELDKNTIVLVGATGLTQSPDGTNIKNVTQWYSVDSTVLQLKDGLHTDKILYRVGNLNAIPLSAFFKAEDLTGSFSVRVVDIIGTDLHNKTWADKYTDSNYYTNVGDVTIDGIYSNGSINFANTDAAGFTGPIRVELYDSTSKAIYAQLFLEVVDGKNMTTSAISPNSNNKNVCLLQDIHLSAQNAIVINNGFAFYGNGFTIHDDRLLRNEDGSINTSATDNTKVKNGIVQIANGILENVQIMGYYMDSPGIVYNNNQGHASVVYITGDANIYNSYIYGGSSPVMINGGFKVHLEGVTLDGGAFCNLQLISDARLTLKDCTTTTDTQGHAKGFGVVVCNKYAKLNLEGTLTQYNWLSLDEVGKINSKLKTPLNSLYSNTNYYCTSNSVKYVNMGVFLGDAISFAQDITPEIADDILDVDTAISNQYGDIEKGESSGLVVSAYLPKKTDDSAATIGKVPTYDLTGYRVYKPSFSFTNTNVKDTDNNSSSGSNIESVSYSAGGPIKVETKASQVVLDLSGIALQWYGRNAGYTLAIDGVAVSNPKQITLNSAPVYYTVTITPTVCSRTSNGEPDASVDQATLASTIDLMIINTSFTTKPTWVSTGSGANHLWLMTGSVDSSYIVDYSEAVPFYDGLEVSFVDKNGSAAIVTLTGNTTVPVRTGLKSYEATITGNFAGEAKLTITSSVTGYQFAVCKYSEDDQTERLYYFNTGVHDAKGSYSVKLTYTFTDPNGQSSASTSVTYSFTSSSPKTMELSTFEDGGPAASSGGSSGGGFPCVTPDTLVTLADGTKKEIQHVTYEDQLLVWNFYTGKYDVMPASIVMNHGYRNYKVVTLNFADGTTVNTINGHGFFDVSQRKYVILRDNNAEDYIGHDFVKVDGDGYTTTKLVSYSVKTEYTESWSILTAEYYNCILEDMWTVTPAEVEGSPDYLMPFVVGADMKYDEALMQADIAKYGLYTYADFAEYMTEEQFNALGLSTWKVAVGKGYISWEDILYLISIHIG